MRTTPTKTTRHLIVFDFHSDQLGWREVRNEAHEDHLLLPVTVTFWFRLMCPVYSYTLFTA